MGSMFLLVSYSGFIRRGSSDPTAELVFVSFQDPSGCEEVDRIVHSLMFVYRTQAWGEQTP